MTGGDHQDVTELHGGGERGKQVNFIVTQAKCPYDCLCRRRLKRSFNDRYPTV